MTDWKPPTEFPNLSGAKMIAVDTETRDTNIQCGPGNIRSKSGLERSYMVGASIGVGPRDGEQWYFPFDHTDIDKSDTGNMDRDQVIRFLKDNLASDVPKLGANLLYDLGWLATEGIKVGGKMYDVQNAEPLIDENARSYALSKLCAKYGTAGKDEQGMYDWQANAFGGQATRRAQAKNIWRTPARVVGPYAESDVREPFEVFEQQKKILEAEGLTDLFDMETRLVPLLHAMRERGVLVDLEHAREHLERLAGANSKALDILHEHNISEWANNSIADYCKLNGVEYELTEAGNPSFPSKWLEKQDDEVLRRVADARRLGKNTGTFIQGTVLNHSVNGRIHCSFNQLRGDNYGTVSGRFSSSNPNLQNIPSRDDELGPMIRGLFIPDPGEIWFSDDWSQIEYRLLVHYGVLSRMPSAIKAQAQYRDNPDMSFHKWVAELTGLEYKPAKNMNFGLVYGMGQAKMAADLGLTMEEIKPMFSTYHSTLPFIRKLRGDVAKRAERIGYIRTLLGRRRRFDMWEPSDFDKARENVPCGFLQAREQWVNTNFQDLDEETIASRPGTGIKRAFSYKALNALVQGGAADIMKAAMVEIWDSGICDVLGAPLLTVHDELGWSVPDTPEGHEAHAEAVRIMNSDEHYKDQMITDGGIVVPLITDSESGPSWGAAK